VERQDSSGRGWTQVSSPQNGWIATQYLSCQAQGARIDGGSEQNQSGKNTGLIVGVVIAAVFAVCLVIVAGVLVYSKYKNRNEP